METSPATFENLRALSIEPDPGASGAKLTVDRSTLEKLLNHAASAAHFVGHLDGAIPAGPLGDHVDAVVHGLTELLDDPHTLAAPDATAVDPRVAHHGRADALVRCGRCPVRRSHGAGEPRFDRDRTLAVPSDSTRTARWRGRGATVAGLIVLIELAFRVLGSCGGAP